MTTGTAIVARNSDLALAGPLGSLDAYLDRVSRIPVLSREEEKELAEYFRNAEIPAELEPMKDLFDWREEEAQVRPGPDFDSRLLQRIGEREGGVTPAGGVVRRLGVPRAGADPE